MNVSLRNIIKRFGDTTVVDGVDLDIREGEMFFLLGPSGCGKTTLLRMIAGFYDPDGGDIQFAERRMNGVPAHQRNTALVFQNYAVWPHLTVFENVAYGLRVRNIPEPELRRRVDEALRQVKIEPLRDRRPTSLSGGQQQRVALARAVVVRPHLLLFDEPLSNLDAKLRIEMRDEFRRMHAETRITSIYVTHDQDEALSMASRIAVMHGGKIQQVGTPVEIYKQPANIFVAGFIGEMNFFGPDSSIHKTLAPSHAGKIGFRPEHVEIAADGIPATVRFATYLGAKNQMTLLAKSGEEIKAWTPEIFAEGSEIQFRVEPRHLLHFNN